MKLGITRAISKFNNSSRGNVEIKYIVVHDTGNPKLGAGAINHGKYFGGANRNASAHYFVDESNIVQVVEEQRSAWHCGDGKGKYGITNSNSIGVEICINQDGNYNQSLDNTIGLILCILNRHGLDTSSVVRHYDASSKICPRTMSVDTWIAWYQFKLSLIKRHKIGGCNGRYI